MQIVTFSSAIRQSVFFPPAEFICDHRRRHSIFAYQFRPTAIVPALNQIQIISHAVSITYRYLEALEKLVTVGNSQNITYIHSKTSCVKNYYRLRRQNANWNLVRTANEYIKGNFSHKGYSPQHTQCVWAERIDGAIKQLSQL